MFLGMLVAWMIPDVPRSLREQLKKENMALMEFLLNQDQEACGKNPSSKTSIPCLSANIDIVVDAPPEDMPELAWGEKKEEEEEKPAVEINPIRSDNSKPPEEEDEHNDKEEKGDEVEGENEVAEDIEKKQEEEDGKVDEKEKDQEEEKPRNEAESDAKEAESENFTVDLDSFMSEMGLLGGKAHTIVLFSLVF